MHLGILTQAGDLNKSSRAGLIQCQHSRVCYHSFKTAGLEDKTESSRGVFDLLVKPRLRGIAQSTMHTGLEDSVNNASARKTIRIQMPNMEVWV